MNTRNKLCILSCILLVGALLTACGGQAATAPAQKPGVVYLDPNAAPAQGEKAPEPAERETAAPAETSTAASEASAPAQPPEQPSETEAEEGPLDLYFESRGVRMEPWMEAAPVLSALGEPIGSFEADSCAYIGKDMFYYYPGFELTVNEVEGVNRITAVTVADDTITIPQGLRIYDEEEKLLSLLGGTEQNGLYTYQSGQTLLLIQVKEAEDDIRRIATMEYRVAEGQ